ncbi:MAG: UDP-N-acetylglucosamine 1-carboxyvinyltransferase [Leucobacter sp.]
MTRATIFGGSAPQGTIRVSGAKNSATRLLSAAMVADGPVELGGFPTHIKDVEYKVAFIRALGGTVDLDHAGERVTIDSSRLAYAPLEPSFVHLPLRTTYLLAAGQLLRSGKAIVGFPGGDAIGGAPGGGRGYDQHVMVWERLGCTVTESELGIEISAPNGLHGTRIDFTISTVGGTETALICASIAHGPSELTNAYITPEVEDLIELLRRMGASIEVFGNSRIEIHGLGGPLDGAHMDVMPDRIEALTWIVYGVLSGGDLTVERVPFDSLEVPLLHLEKAGIDLFRNSSAAHITPGTLLAGSVQPFELSCGTYPGVISDMQALFVLLGLGANGTSRVHDYRYPHRIAWVAELAKLVDGHHLTAETGKITVNGPAKFRAGAAGATDVRGSMVAVLAALLAEGTSTISHVEHALRGYNDLEGKLRSLGLQIEIGH